MRTVENEVAALNKEQLLFEYEKIKTHKSFLSKKFRDLIISKVERLYKKDVKEKMMATNVDVLNAAILETSKHKPGKKLMCVISDPVYTEFALLEMNGHDQIKKDGNDLFLNGTLLIRFTEARNFMTIPETVTESMMYVAETIRNY